MLVMAFPLFVIAQTITLQKSVTCGDFNGATEYLKTQYGEVPIWKGRTNIDTEVIFYLNPQTNSWTLIETNGELACSIAVGETIEALNKIKHTLTF